MFQDNLSVMSKIVVIKFTHQVHSTTIFIIMQAPELFLLE